MTKSEREQQRDLQALLSEHLRERARLLLTGQTEVLQLLKDARTQILATLAGQPANWQQLHLSQLLGQVEDVLAGATGQASARFAVGMQSAWSAGEAMVDAAVDLLGESRLSLMLPQLDVRVLTHMRAFGDLRLRDVGDEAARKIARQLGLTMLGGQTPQEAIKKIQATLESETPARATAIVRTSLGQAWATASQERMQQAAGALPGLGKQWRRSGKINSRWNHDIMDGQVCPAGEKFKVPNPSTGGFDMMTGPHDPTAPVEQLINCGCVALPWMSHWKVMTPGAKPFTEREKKLDPRKAALDQAAKRAGRRKE